MEFKYIGRVLTDSYENWPKVVGNLRKERRRCGKMSRILGQEVADPCTYSNIYKLVVQVTLLYGS